MSAARGNFQTQVTKYFTKLIASLHPYTHVERGAMLTSPISQLSHNTHL